MSDSSASALDASYAAESEMAISSVSFSSAVASPTAAWNSSDPAYVSFGSYVSNNQAVASAQASAFPSSGNELQSFFTTPAGVGVGAGIGAAVLLALIAVCLCVRVRRRRRRAAKAFEEKPTLPPRRSVNRGHLDLLGDSYGTSLPASSQLSLSSPLSPLDPVQLRDAVSFQGGMPFERHTGINPTARGSVTATDSEFDAFAVDGSSLARTLTNASTSDSGWRGARGQRRLSNTDSSPPASLHRVMRYAGDMTPNGTLNSYSQQSTVLRTPATRSNSDPFRNPSPPLPPLPPHTQRGYPYPPPTESAPSVADDDEDGEWQPRPPSMFGGSENNDQERAVPPSYVDLYGQDGLRR